VKLIAIDEISIRKGHTYITIVMDLESGAIIFVGKGKGQDALKPFWKRLSASKAKIKAAATDMSSAYYATVQKNLPSATLVFDRFHIVKLMNEKLTKLRRELYRELYREAKEGLRRDVLKGTRWLLLKASANLDGSIGRDEQQNKNNETPRVRLSRRRILQAQTVRPARIQIQTNRLTHPAHIVCR